MTVPRRARPAFATVALLAACSGGADVADPPLSTAPDVHGGIAYSAQTLVMESFPVQLATEVTLRNVSDRSNTVQLASGCPVHLRVYRSADLRDPVWDQGATMACTKQIQIVELAPGESARRTTTATGWDVLGDSLPDGRYTLGAYVAVVGNPLVVPAGTVDLAVPR